MNALSKKSFYPWVIIGFSSLFLFYKYVLYFSPNVMTDQLMQHFHLNGEGLGNLAAMYFYTYLIAQLFAGPFLDHFSPRKITTLAIIIAAVGSILFAISSSLLAAWIARACIGFGVAFATVSYMKMASLYFKPEKFAFISGLLITAVMLGSMCGQTPLALLIKHVGWQQSLMYCSYAGIAFAALFFIFVKDKPAKASAVKTSSASWKDIIAIIKKKSNWLMTFYSGLAYLPLALFAGLWGNPFLKAAYNISTTDAATLTSIMLVGFAIGGPLFGYLSDRWQNRVGLMSLGLWLSIFSIFAIIYISHLNYFFLAFFLFLFGFATGAFMLSFAVGRDLNNVALMATLVSLLNTGEPILGSFSDPLVGKILDIFWNGNVVNGVHVFSATDYRIALALLPLYLVLAFLCLVLLKYTKDGIRLYRKVSIPDFAIPEID